jgi:hypothetical protein
MAKKAQSHKSIYRRDDLWIAPSLSLKTKTIKAIGNFREASRMKNRYLQLADIALGRAPINYKTKRSA